MNIVLITLLVIILVIVIFSIMFFIPTPPFNPHYIHPNPRNWQVEPYPTNETERIYFQKDFDYGPFSANFADEQIYDVYRYFYNNYCTENNKDTINCGAKMPPLSDLIVG